MEKPCTGLKFDLVHFNGPQTKFICDSLYKHPVDSFLCGLLNLTVCMVQLPDFVFTTRPIMSWSRLETMEKYLGNIFKAAASHISPLPIRHIRISESINTFSFVGALILKGYMNRNE